MNNEIKEILNKWKCYIELTKKFTTNEYEMLRVEDIDKLLDYITNLQEENKRLKEENKHIFANVNDDQLLRSNAMNYAEAQDYKTRNEKAIEYINNINGGIVCSNFNPYLDYLLNLLQGKSDE